MSETPYRDPFGVRLAAALTVGGLALGSVLHGWALVAPSVMAYIGGVGLCVELSRVKRPARPVAQTGRYQTVPPFGYELVVEEMHHGSSVITLTYLQRATQADRARREGGGA